MQKYALSALVYTSVAAFLVACGGGGSGSPSAGEPPIAEPPSNDTTLTGVFSDSPVAGVSYRTATQSGITNGQGEFEYVEGEEVTFSVGGIAFPTTAAKSRVTPLDMDANAAEPMSDTVVNVLRFLQTLDSDGDPENGITISAETASALAGAALDFGAPTFEGEAQGIAQERLDKNLVSEGDAVDHFQNALKADLLGSWVYEEPNGIVNVLSFIDESTYIIAHSQADDGDQPAASVEFGSYEWDPVSGDFSVTAVRTESDNSGGLYDETNPTASQGWTAYIDGEDLVLEPAPGERISFSAVTSAGNPLVGAWFLYEPDLDNYNVLTFLDSTRYVIAHSHNTEAYDGGLPVEASSEWGTYTWNASSGAFEVTSVQVENDGPGGLYDEDGVVGDGALASNGDLRFSLDEGDVDFGPLGRYAVELIDFEGDTAEAALVRDIGYFSGEVTGTYELPDFAAGSAGEYDVNPGSANIRVTLEEGGSGSITFPPSADNGNAEDTNAVTWTLGANGVLRFTEVDGSGDSWFWTVTPVASDDSNLLIQVVTPPEQSDAANVAILAPFVEEGALAARSEAFLTDDLDGVVYNVWHEDGTALVTELALNPGTGTVVATGDDLSDPIHGTHQLTGDGRVIAVDFEDESHTDWIVHDGYDAARQAYRMCWIDDSDVTTAEGALARAASSSCTEYLATDADVADAIATEFETGVQSIDLNGSWKVTESYDICSNELNVLYKNSYFDIGGGEATWSHDYVDDIHMSGSDCTSVENDEPTDAGTESFAGDSVFTEAELMELLGDADETQSVTIESPDRFTMIETFSSGQGQVEVTQTWTRVL